MSLSSGTRLGPYEIEAQIGTGGMGEVYRANDTRLCRTVAIKVLASDFFGPIERRQRFEREARAIASLNHPNICTLYDVGQSNGLDFLVMEYLEGETLETRLSHGALKTDQLLRYAIQIAMALDRAHRQGFVHRDLKPGNIMLTRTGVKLLDFGLATIARGAKTDEVAISGTDSSLTTQPLTAEHTIVGTLPYMAPEQLEGKETDSRTDIFAFGAILYEMATGRRAFEGKSQASLIAAILGAEPKPLGESQPLASHALERVVRTCLAKDPEERWQSARDIMREIEWITEAEKHPGQGVPQLLSRRRLVSILCVGVILVTAMLLAVLRFRRALPEPQQVRFSFQTPDKELVGPLSVSPDGRYIAICGHSLNRSRLMVRPLNSFSTQAMSGTEGAQFPFWSPDGRFIGFFAGGKLRKIAVSGGPAQTLCDAADGRGGSWNDEGTIIFSPSPGGVLYSVSAAGGLATPVTAQVTSMNLEVHRFPQFLPDGRHFVFEMSTEAGGEDGIYFASLDSKNPRRLLADASNAQYVPASASERRGYLLFVREHTLLAQPFDAERIQTTGEAFPVGEQISRVLLGYFGFSASRNGVLVYETSTYPWTSELLWFDREGKRIGTVGKPGNYASVSLSPDKKRVAVTHIISVDRSDIWIHGLTRDSASPFTFGPVSDATPVWSPDGSRLAFLSNHEGTFYIYQKETSGTGNQELLLKSERPLSVLDWSPDGRFIVYGALGSTAQFDLWLLPASGDHKPVPLLQSEFNESQAQLSPDGRWLAYRSDESGADEIYVRPFLVSGERRLVSRSGGWQPRWRGDGQELFYIAPDLQLMSVKIRSGHKSTEFEGSPPQPLFQTAILSALSGFFCGYDVSIDGQRFLINTVPGEGVHATVNVVVNWQAGLKQ